MKRLFLGAALLAGISFAMPAWSGFFSSDCDGASDKPKPDWVSRQDYSKPGYYVGVGSSDKKDTTKRQEESETLATKELVEHIEVKIKAENEQSTSVNNQGVQKDAFSKVTVSADEVLRGIVTQDQWLDKDTCRLYSLKVISTQAVAQAKLEKTMKIRLGKFKERLAEGSNRDKNPDINVRRQDLADAQSLLQEIDFKQLSDVATVNSRGYYEQQLKDAFASINKESSQAKGMAVFVLNKDHNLKDNVIGKMVDQLRSADQSTDRLMDNCDQEEACKKVAKEHGFGKLTILIANCKVEVSQMGSLKGTLTVTKKIYDLNNRRIIDESHAMSAEVIGWSNDELDWNAAEEKVMLGLK